MCYTCGCNRPYDDMGNKDNITEDYFDKAGKATAGDKTTAKKNMIALLQKEVGEEMENPKEQY